MIVRAALSRNVDFGRRRLGHDHHGGQAPLEFLFFLPQRRQVATSIANVRGRDVVEVVRVQLEFLDGGPLRVRLARDLVERFGERQNRDLVLVQHARINADVVDQPAEAALRSPASADSKRLPENAPALRKGR